MVNLWTSRFGLICVFVVLNFQGYVVAQKPVDPAPLVKASVTVDSATLAPGKPAFVTVTIENISGREIDLKTTGSFELLSTSNEAVSRKHRVFGDSYWSPVNLIDSTPVELTIIDAEKLKKGVVVGRVPKAALQLARDEIKNFKVDLTKVHWNESMGSIWPHRNLFEAVRKGPYSLVFFIRNGGAIKSNEVKVSVE